MPLKKRMLWGILLSTVVLAGVIVGCSREERYKILTFFFEGVPSLDGEPQSEGPEIVSRRRREDPSANRRTRPGRASLQTDASSHRPAGDCLRCHQKNRRWDRKQLYKPLPDLCYSCHTNYNLVPGNVHGPVVAGACLFCHDPHGSEYVHLQKAPEPALCYQCHVREDVDSITDHQNYHERVCSECHDPHISSDRMLLKRYRETKDDPNSAVPTE